MKRIKLAVFCVILMILIISAVGLLFGNPWRDRAASDTPEAPDAFPETIQKWEVYDEQLLRETAENRMFQLMAHGESVAVSVREEKDISVHDVDTWDTAYAIPEAWQADMFAAYGIDADADGNLYSVTVLQEEQSVAIRMHCADASRPDETIMLADFGGTLSEDNGRIFFIRLLRFEADSNYFYLLSTYEGGRILQVFTHDGTLYREYENVVDFEVDQSGGLYIAINASDKLCKYDVESNELLYQATIDQTQGEFYMLHLALEPKGELLYVQTNASVQIYAAESGSFIKLAMSMQQGGVALAEPTEGMRVDGNQNLYFLILTNDSANKQIYQYRIVKNVREQMADTLVISAPYRNNFLSAAIALYEKEYPDQKIKYDCAYNSQSGFYENSDKDGYFAQANVKLLTGDVGDIVMTGGKWSDVYQRFKTDLFADLKPMLKQDPSFSELDETMLRGVTIDGKICGLPVAGVYFYTEVNTALCTKLGIDLDWNNATWGDVIQLAERLKGTDYYVFATDSPDRVFVRMLISNMPDLIDLENKKLDLRQPWFVALLEQWKQAMQTSHLYGETPATQVSHQEEGAHPISRSTLAKQSLLSIDEQTGSGWQRDYVWTYEQINRDFGGMRYAPLFSGEKHTNRTAYSEDLYSIMQSSKNKEAAWQFLSFLMRRDAQQLHVLYNVKLNAEVRNADVEQAILAETPENQPMARQYGEDIKNVYQSVDTFYDMNKLKEDLFYPLLKYLSGEMSLDDALTQAERDLWIRINE